VEGADLFSNSAALGDTTAPFSSTGRGASSILRGTGGNGLRCGREVFEVDLSSIPRSGGGGGGGSVGTGTCEKRSGIGFFRVVSRGLLVLSRGLAVLSRGEVVDSATDTMAGTGAEGGDSCVGERGRREGDLVERAGVENTGVSSEVADGEDGGVVPLMAELGAGSITAGAAMSCGEVARRGMAAAEGAGREGACASAMAWTRTVSN
jgi:hypothetical protein